ncbi:UNVERIFIED_CONTAM: hypothetical protein FKN15_037322 [Acipenser sinensis]
MDRNALAVLLEALESRRDAEERRREECYTVLIERPTLISLSSNTTTTISPMTQTSETADPNGPPCLPTMETKVGPQLRKRCCPCPVAIPAAG